MAETKSPQEITEASVETGTTKAKIEPQKVLVGSFLAGAYIGFGGLLAIAVSSGFDEQILGTVPLFFRGLVFSLGLILVVIAGSELLTGNMALVPIAMMRGRVAYSQLVSNIGLVLVGNFLGAVFVAFFLAVQTGVLTDQPQLSTLEEIALLKGQEETVWQIFLRALGANWLVCLAVWLALSATDVAGKILAIIFPILAFVAMGFDHVIANMFFLPAAIFAGVDLSWLDALKNFFFAFLGNFVGAAVFVSGAYYFLYGRDGEKPGGGRPGAQRQRRERPARERELVGTGGGGSA
jgi:formate/nitrite transporter